MSKFGPGMLMRMRLVLHQSSSLYVFWEIRIIPLLIRTRRVFVSVLMTLACLVVCFVKSIHLMFIKCRVLFWLVISLCSKGFLVTYDVGDCLSWDFGS